MQAHISYRSARLIALGQSCAICGAGESLTVHHRLPRRICRVNAPANLVTVCRTCHDTIEALDQLSYDLLWATEHQLAAPQIRADVARGASIVQRAVELLRAGGCHGWSHALDCARQELSGA